MITIIAIFISAIYINASIIIQIKYFHAENNTQLIWIGLAHFSIFDGEDGEVYRMHIGETIAEYVLTIAVYITCLIYRKAAYRHGLKEKYMRQKYPERYLKRRLGLEVKRGKTGKKNRINSCLKIVLECLNLLKNPYVHMMIFRFLLFVW